MTMVAQPIGATVDREESASELVRPDADFRTTALGIGTAPTDMGQVRRKERSRAKPLMRPGADDK